MSCLQRRNVDSWLGCSHGTHEATWIQAASHVYYSHVDDKIHFHLEQQLNMLIDEYTFTITIYLYKTEECKFVTNGYGVIISFIEILQTPVFSF